MARVWFDVALRSAPAPRRSTNQDAAAGWPDAVVVADGVGGHAGGEVASATVTGHLVAALAQKHGVTATRIAYGVPVGGELEFIDSGTLSRALTGRRRIEASDER